MILFFLLIAVAIALFLQRTAIEKSLDAIEGDHSPDKRLVDPEETFAIRITVQNGSRRFIPFVRICERLREEFCLPTGEITAKEDYSGGSRVEFTAWLRPRQILIREIPVHIARRGRYVLTDLVLYGGDFLGLREQSKTCGHFNEVIVAPRETACAQLNEVFGGFMGDVSANRFILEDPVLTLGSREYTGREPMKMIAWSQSAKRGTLMVKKSDYTLEPTVSVVLNTETELPEKEVLLETCYSLARTVCTMLEKRGVKYTFVSNASAAGRFGKTVFFAEGLGASHYAGILEFLGRATDQCSVSLEQLLWDEVRRHDAAGRILITPGGGEENIRMVGRLREVASGNLLVLRGVEVMTWQ